MFFFFSTIMDAHSGIFRIDIILMVERQWKNEKNNRNVCSAANGLMVYRYAQYSHSPHSWFLCLFTSYPFSQVRGSVGVYTLIFYYHLILVSKRRKFMRFFFLFTSYIRSSRNIYISREKEYKRRRRRHLRDSLTSAQSVSNHETSSYCTMCSIIMIMAPFISLLECEYTRVSRIKAGWWWELFEPPFVP